jgi:hypothetical protein
MQDFLEVATLFKLSEAGEQLTVYGEAWRFVKVAARLIV